VSSSLQASPDGNIYWLAASYMPNPTLKLVLEGGDITIRITQDIRRLLTPPHFPASPNWRWVPA